MRINWLNIGLGALAGGAMGLIGTAVGAPVAVIFAFAFMAGFVTGIFRPAIEFDR